MVLTICGFKLTSVQIDVIAHVKEKYDFCIHASRRTMDSLVGKGLAQYTEGFGHGYGYLIELTEDGKKVRSYWRDLYRTHDWG